MSCFFAAFLGAHLSCVQTSQPVNVAPQPVAQPMVSNTVAEASCSPQFHGSFIQINSSQFHYTAVDWTRELELLRSVSADTVVIQFTGDPGGAFDNRKADDRPVSALLNAASLLNMQVFLGLHHDPRWPHEAVASEGLPPPLDQSEVTDYLVSICRIHASCAGWYLPQEVDDQTWSSPQATIKLREFLRNARQTLARLDPGRPVAIAPYFTGKLEPAAHAQWWSTVLPSTGINIVMLQDGVGTRRASSREAADYLRDFRRVAEREHVRLWSVIELFSQVHGYPVDHEPFAAVPATYAQVRRSLLEEAPIVERMIAFTILDYMNPKRGRAAKTLYEAVRGQSSVCNRNEGDGGI